MDQRSQISIILLNVIGTTCADAFLTPKEAILHHYEEGIRTHKPGCLALEPFKPPKFCVMGDCDKGREPTCKCLPFYAGRLCDKYVGMCRSPWQCYPHQCQEDASKARGFTCRCNLGFQNSKNTEDPLCYDINECSSETQHCQKTEKCINLHGGFRCVGSPSTMHTNNVKPIRGSRNQLVQIKSLQQLHGSRQYVPATSAPWSDEDYIDDQSQVFQRKLEKSTSSNHVAQLSNQQRSSVQRFKTSEDKKMRSLQDNVNTFLDDYNVYVPNCTIEKSYCQNRYVYFLLVLLHFVNS